MPWKTLFDERGLDLVSTEHKKTSPQIWPKLMYFQGLNFSNQAFKEPHEVGFTFGEKKWVVDLPKIQCMIRSTIRIGFEFDKLEGLDIITHIHIHTRASAHMHTPAHAHTIQCVYRVTRDKYTIGAQRMPLKLLFFCFNWFWYAHTLEVTSNRYITTSGFQNFFSFSWFCLQFLTLFFLQFIQKKKKLLYIYMFLSFYQYDIFIFLSIIVQKSIISLKT